MFFGVIGLFKFKNFYPRILVASKVDTVGMVTLLIGVAVRHGVSFLSGKVLLLIMIIMIFNPLVSHILARSAYLSGHTPDSDKAANKPIESAKITVNNKGAL